MYHSCAQVCTTAGSCAEAVRCEGVDTAECPEGDRQLAYLRAAAVFVLQLDKTQRIERVFCSLRKGARGHFGWGVPGLLVCPAAGQYSLYVYPHREGTETRTICSYLEKVSANLSAGIHRRPARGRQFDREAQNADRGSRQRESWHVGRQHQGRELFVLQWSWMMPVSVPDTEQQLLKDRVQ